MNIETVRLDEWCPAQNYSMIDLLKVDTEGFDLQVLEGAERLFRSRRVRFVYVEFNDLQPSRDAVGGALLPIDTLLGSHGFRFVCTYVDNVGTEGELFFTSNALFMLQP